MGKLDMIELVLTLSITLIQFIPSLWDTITSGTYMIIPYKLLTQNNADALFCALLILSLLGVFSRRRYIIVFTCMAMGTSFFEALRWTVTVYYRYFQGEILSCERSKMRGKDYQACRNADLWLLFLSQVATWITLAAFILVSFRLHAPSASKVIHHPRTPLVASSYRPATHLKSSPSSSIQTESQS